MYNKAYTSFKVKRLKVKVTRPINAKIKCVSYLAKVKAYELQTWYTDGGRRRVSPTNSETCKVKAQGRKVTLSV